MTSPGEGYRLSPKDRARLVRLRDAYASARFARERRVTLRALNREKARLLALGASYGEVIGLVNGTPGLP